MEKNLSEIIEKLMDTHIETWGTVDDVESDDDSVVLKGARKGMELNLIRSNLVEAVDEIVIKKLPTNLRP